MQSARTRAVAGDALVSVFFDDGARRLDREAFYLDDEAPRFDREAFFLDDEAPKLDGEAFCLDDEAPSFDREAFFLDDEARSFDDEAFFLDGEASRLEGATTLRFGSCPKRPALTAIHPCSSVRNYPASTPSDSAARHAPRLRPRRQLRPGLRS